MIIQITKENYEAEVLNSEKPVLLDFGAPWCVPCKHLHKTVDEISQETDAIKFGYVDIDAYPDLAAKNSVISIPMLIFFKDGKVAAKMAGVKSKSAILATLNK